MSTLPERPKGANDTPPLKCTSNDLPRWAELGLADPLPDACLPEQGSTADLLAFALVLPGADDPVAGIVDAVRIELSALARMLEERVAGDLLLLLSNRLAVASLLLRRTDGLAPMPREWDPDAVTQTEPPKNSHGGPPDEGEGGA